MLLLPVYCKATPGISLYVNIFYIRPPEDLKATRSRTLKVYPCNNASDVSVHVPSLYLFPYHLQIKKMIFTF